MSTLEIHLSDTAQTETLGRGLAQLQPAPAVIYLSGELGAGKTTFSRGFIQACGHRGPVKSPTYTLIEPYELPGVKVYHLDLYRLHDPAELEFLGLEDLLTEGGVYLIEWPERASPYLPPPDLTISLHHAGGARQARLTAHQPRAEAWLTALVAHFPANSHLID
jgi:tRNA threonylcarbamoyladenosine biosynthesis protein TsaE